MSASPVSTVRNGFLSPEPLGPRSGHSRSSSVTPSERSNRSRVTLVEHNPDLTSGHDSDVDDTYKVVTYLPPKYSRFDHLLGFLGFDLSKRKNPIMEESFVRPKVPDVLDVDEGSPWILPVFVLSTRKDTDKNNVAVQAKCTIDTGNMQGNIVSRDFVETALEYSPSHFSVLTDEEKEGGSGITGHKLIPDGAIYLTWYHKRSTRVFRNMRFLISPNQHCDLIIGARSILKDQLLDVPNLLSEPRLGRTLARNPGPQDEKRKGLHDRWYLLDEEINNLKVRERQEKDNADELVSISAEVAEVGKKHAIASLELQIYDAQKDTKMEATKKKAIVEKMEKELRALPGYVAKESPQVLQQRPAGSSGVEVKEAPAKVTKRV